MPRSLTHPHQRVSPAPSSLSPPIPLSHPRQRAPLAPSLLPSTGGGAHPLAPPPMVAMTRSSSSTYAFSRFGHAATRMCSCMAMEWHGCVETDLCVLGGLVYGLIGLVHMFCFFIYCFYSINRGRHKTALLNQSFTMTFIPRQLQ